MAKVEKRFDVCAGRKYTVKGEEKTKWENLGRAVQWDNGDISIQLVTVPVGNWFDGMIRLFEQKPKEDHQQAQQAPYPQRQQPIQQEQDDDLPF